MVVEEYSTSEDPGLFHNDGTVMERTTVSQAPSDAGFETHSPCTIVPSYTHIYLTMPLTGQYPRVRM